MLMHDRLHALFLSLVQQQKIRLASLVLVETVFQRVVELVQVEVLSASMIGSIEKWAMLALRLHRCILNGASTVYRHSRSSRVKY